MKAGIENLPGNDRNNTNLNNQHCYLIYVTANDDPTYINDFFNFDDMARMNPGVSHIDIIIAISQARPFRAIDIMALNALRKRAEDSGWLKVLNIVWKGNVGRDFSSAQACFALLANVISEYDYIMVRNRSSYGPLAVNWYQAYKRQYHKFPNTGMVGSSINLSGHPLMSDPKNAIHVQTYCYFSQWLHLKKLVDDFPGIGCLNKFDVIVQGEIALSGRIMENDLQISCLQWPNDVFNLSMRHSSVTLNGSGIKSVANIPIRYRIYRKSFRRPRGLIFGLLWLFRIKIMSYFYSGLQPNNYFSEKHVRIFNYDYWLYASLMTGLFIG